MYLYEFGPVSVSPGEQLGSRCYAVPANTEITITWDAPEDFYELVNFHLNTDDNVIGVDESPSSRSARITATFPANMPPSKLWAVGWAVDNGTVSETIIIFTED